MVQIALFHQNTLEATQGQVCDYPAASGSTANYQNFSL
jgi:hypothetical protein